MAKFAVLQEESKILRRKEKEAERQQKIQEKMSQVASQPSVGNWADASDDEEDERLFRPVSDSESEKSEEEEPADDWDAANEDKPAEREKANENKTTEAAAPKGKSKKKGKADAEKPVEEDLDDLLAEFGVEVAEVETTSKKKKKKAAEAVGDAAPADAVNGKPKPGGAELGEAEKRSAKTKIDSEKKADREAARSPSPEAEELAGAEDATPVSREAALEALKKKQAAKGKKGSSTSAVKLAAAEAKARSAGKKPKPDKSMYDR